MNTHANIRPTWELWISAGTGPQEACRFVAALAKRLESASVDAGLELVPARSDDGDGEAPASICLGLRGDAEAALADLLGVHALVHDSRRARAGRRRGHRKRWLAKVALRRLCVAPMQVLDPADVEFRFARSGGPGGQHVNTSATAVRAVHRPTGIAVRVSDSRSQDHNRVLALERLGEKLRDSDIAKRRAAAQGAWAQRCARVRGEPVAVWRWDSRSGLCPA